MKGSLSIKEVLPAAWQSNPRLREREEFRKYAGCDSSGNLVNPCETLPPLPIAEKEEVVKEGTGEIIDLLAGGSSLNYQRGIDNRFDEQVVEARKFLRGFRQFFFYLHTLRFDLTCSSLGVAAFLLRFESLNKFRQIKRSGRNAVSASIFSSRDKSVQTSRTPGNGLCCCSRPDKIYRIIFCRVPNGVQLSKDLLPTFPASDETLSASLLENAGLLETRNRRHG